MRRRVAIVVALSMMWSLIVPAAFAQEPAVGRAGLIQIEQILFGRAQEGALLTRLERVERDVFGRTQDGSAFLVRLQRLQDLLIGAEGDVSIKMKLNAIEW